MVRLFNDSLVAAAKVFAGFFAAVLFMYYYFIGNRHPGMACS